MKVSFKVICTMEKELLQLLKEFIQEILEMDSKMVMESLDGKMDLFIVGLIIMAKGKETDSFITPRIQVLVEVFGKKEFYRDKESMLKHKEKDSNVFGVKEKSLD